MNNLIKKELLKCKICQLPEIKEDLVSFIVPVFEGEDKRNNLELNHYYVIKINKNISNPDDFSVLASNWNKGIVPKSQYLLCVPKKHLGKMIQMDACGWDDENQISLSDVYMDFWLPKDGFKKIKEINY